MMSEGEQVGCVFMVLVLMAISFFFGAAIFNKRWNDWNIQRAVESGEAHYDTKTGKLIWEGKQ